MPTPPMVSALAIRTSPSGDQRRLHDAGARLPPVLPEQRAVGRRDAGRPRSSQQQDLSDAVDRHQMWRAVARPPVGPNQRGWPVATS